MTPRFVALFAAGLLPLLLSLVVPWMRLLTAGWDAALVVLLFVDLALLPRREGLEVRRAVDELVSLGAVVPVSLRFRWHGPRRARLDWVDTPPGEMHAEGHRGRLELPPGTEGVEHYTVVPHRRGAQRFGAVHLRLFGPLGLARKLHRVDHDQVVRVYPDIRRLFRGERALLERLDAGDLKARRRMSEGREFDTLREYVPGDDVRQIDWKATARRGEPITRRYRPEQNQDVYLVVDCGRHMRARVDAGGSTGVRSRLDVAVNAALSLAHAALTRGDQVGLVVFDHALRAYLPPKKGREQLLRIVEALYLVEPTLTESDYHAAFDALGRHTTRRALVVVFTDLVDEDASRVLLGRLRLLARRHLPLVVTLTDSGLRDLTARPPDTDDDAWRFFAAERLLEEQRKTLRRLTAGGALLVEAGAEALGAAALSRYLEVKARGAL